MKWATKIWTFLKSIAGMAAVLATLAAAAFLLSNAKRHSRKAARKEADAAWIEDNRTAVTHATARARESREKASDHLLAVKANKRKANAKLKKLEDAGKDVRKLTDLYNSL